MQAIIKKLEEIAAKHKKNGKIGKLDRLDAEQYLSTLLCDSAYRDTGYSFMLSLSPDVSGKAFLKAWLETGDTALREDLVSGLLHFKEFNGEAGNNRLLELSRLFIPASTGVAFRFLVALSERATASGTEKPSEKIVAKFRNSLMKKNELLKIPLREYDLSPREINSVATMVLYSLLPDSHDNPEQDVQWKKFYLDWLGQSRNKPLLPKINDIEKGTARWPEELQRYGVQLGLLKTVTTKLIQKKDTDHISGGREISRGLKPGQVESVHDEKKTAGDAEERSASVEAQTVPGNGRKETGNEFSEKFDAILYLDRLGRYIAELEKHVREVESELLNARMEASREKQSRTFFETRLEQSEKNLRAAEIKIQNLESELTRSRENINRLSTELSETKSKHENEVSSLLEMIDQRSEQAAQQIKNRLARLMRTDYQDFIQIDNDPMTVELGENLRAQLRNIFRTLAEEDIRL